MTNEFFSEAARARVAHFHGQRIGIVGLGREGVDLARFLAPQGAQLVVSDQAPQALLEHQLNRLLDLDVEYRLGNQQASDLLDCNEVFVSPGVPREVAVVAGARSAGIPISSATRLFFELCPGRILGVTGSSGKTTTTRLIGAILDECFDHVLTGGNLGTPMLGRLNEVTPETWCVLELSSFQLEDTIQSPSVAVVLNITPNHLDRHVDMAEYTQAKGNLVRFQGPQNLVALNADDPIVAALPHQSREVWFSLRQPVRGAWLDGDRLMLGLEGSWGRRPSASFPILPRLPWQWKSPTPASSLETAATTPGSAERQLATFIPRSPQVLLLRADLRLRGLHNVANVLAAAATTAGVGCPAETIAEVARHFEPVSHRLEVVASINGVTFVNDSIATSPERSMAGLRSFDAPVVLIAGGRDKHLPMADWAAVIAERARAVVLVGEAIPKIQAALTEAHVDVPIVAAPRFADVVSLARDLAQPGDVVLLSPGCTSFDEFQDFEARGQAFRQSVRALEGNSAC